MKILCIAFIAFFYHDVFSRELQDTVEIHPILSFRIEDRPAVKGKSVMLFEKRGSLSYAFSDSSGKEEFFYPKETDEETPGFIFDTTKNAMSVSFSNKSASYQVYEQPKKVGVNATTKGVLYEQVGVLSSKEGSLKNLLGMKLENVIIR
jgi:hypothetical protein